jgi:hypothetical protein
MFKAVLLWAFVGLLPSLSLAAEQWKPETEQAALDLLQKARKAIGPLRRFEIECQRRILNETYATDERSRVRLYWDQSAGFLLEFRPVDCAKLQASRTQSGELCRLGTTRPETWLMTASACTVLNEDRRIYEIVPVPPDQSWIGSLPVPLQVMPPWFDPTLDWTQFKSRLRIESAESTPREFRIKLAPLQENRAWQLFDDDRLTSRQTLVIDRQTLLPKTWSIAQRSCDVTFVYTRFDPHPPQRELKLDLTGYRNDSPIIQPAAATEASSASSMATLEVGARILLWLLL